MESSIKIGDKVYSVVSDDNYLVAMGGNFEPHMVQLFQALIGPDDVVADIGGNIGLTALLFSSLARKVFAFEPSQSTYKILTENLARAGVANVEAVNLGFGCKTESLSITFAKNNRSGGYVSDKIRPESGHVTEDIRITTFDRYFDDCAITPSFLKIDVEGFEMNVVKGAATFLKEYRPTVVMEMNHFCLDVLHRITIPDFMDYMLSIFPFLYAIDTDNITIADLHDPNSAYCVMYEHVVQHRFPNLVGGFNESIRSKLNALIAANVAAQGRNFKTPVVNDPKGFIKAALVPDNVPVGHVFEISVTLSNEGNEDWLGSGTNPVRLSYHWQNADGSYRVFDGVRTELKSQVVRPGKPVQEMVRVIAPTQNGCFSLNLTVVQEGVCWFEDKGFDNAVSKVTVV